jgi:hypothetical protein
MGGKVGVGDDDLVAVAEASKRVEEFRTEKRVYAAKHGRLP